MYNIFFAVLDLCLDFLSKVFPFPHVVFPFVLKLGVCINLLV